MISSFGAFSIFEWLRVARDTERVRCLAQEHTTMSSGRVRNRGPFLEGPKQLPYLKSCSKISNLMFTELFYAHILNMNRGSLHTRSFMRIHLSAFQYQLTKNGFAGPKSSRNGPQDHSIQTPGRWPLGDRACHSARRQRGNAGVVSDVLSATK